MSILIITIDLHKLNQYKKLNTTFYFIQHANISYTKY